MVHLNILATSIAFIAATAAKADLKFGTATASYQIEGAVNEGGRSPSIWDEFVQQPGKIVNGDTGDVACDHFHHIDDDIALLRELGVDRYRFSISWSRLLPQGSCGGVGNCVASAEGLAFYNRIIDALVAADIEPFITIYHWDLPLSLQQAYGGWVDGQIVNDYLAYADFVFEQFGDRVKHWFTFNEPYVFCLQGYKVGFHAPGLKSSANHLQCAHHVLLSHAHTAALYRRKYKQSQHGKLGLALNCDWQEPLTPLKRDRDAAQRKLDFNFGWFADPLYFGDYPESMRSMIPAGLLPVFSEEEKRLVNGSTDFFGVNHYTSNYAYHKAGVPSWDDAVSTPFSLLHRPIGKRGESTWLYVVPWGLGKLLTYIDKRYGHPEIHISENGVSVPGEGSLTAEQAVHDVFRQEYLRDYLHHVELAIEAGVNVATYFVWSLLDNFEWAMGYKERFGVVYVDFTSDQRTRTMKDSGRWLKSYFDNRHLNATFVQQN